MTATYDGDLDVLARKMLDRHGYRAALLLVELSEGQNANDECALEILRDVRAALARLAGKRPDSDPPG